MKFETVQYRFDEVTECFDKKRIPLSSTQRAKHQGKYRYYGAQGVIDYIDDFIFDGSYLLIAEDGENLKSQKQNIAQMVSGKFWVNNHAHIVRGNSLCLTEYLCYLINQADLSGYITGSAQPKLSQSNMNAIVLNIPSLEIQRQIVSVLSALDDKIALNQRINDNLEQQAQAIFEESFVNYVSDDWKTGTIADLGKVVGGATPSKSKAEYYTQDGIAWITPKDLSVDKSKFIYHGAIDITESGLKHSSACIMPKGSVLFSSRAPIGYIAIAGGKVTTNQGFKSIVPFKNIGTAYVYCFLKAHLPVIEGMASGSTFKEVSGSVMKSVPAMIPDNDSLRKFNEFCIPLFEKQAQLELENARLVALRDALLPRLMSGEIDVSEVEI